MGHRRSHSAQMTMVLLQKLQLPQTIKRQPACTAGLHVSLPISLAFTRVGPAGDILQHQAAASP
jgi:hypothetical protein